MPVGGETDDEVEDWGQEPCFLGSRIRLLQTALWLNVKDMAEPKNAIDRPRTYRATGRIESYSICVCFE